MPKMLFAEHENIVKAVPSDRADQPLRTAVLPWRPRRDRSIAYTHRLKAPGEDFPVSTISIANDASRRFPPPQASVS
jgi:hypothetical protein